MLNVFEMKKQKYRICHLNPFIENSAFFGHCHKHKKWLPVRNKKHIHNPFLNKYENGNCWILVETMGNIKFLVLLFELR